MKKKVSVSYYKKKLDTIFSLFIRLRDSDEHGYASCYTCGVTKHYKELQCGHFAPRQYLSLRYDERNCHTQCYACNMLYNGQPSAYAEHLKRDYGEEILTEIEQKRKEVTKNFPYEVKLEHYKQAVKDLQENSLSTL